jgi:hypothetical protein
VSFGYDVGLIAALLASFFASVSNFFMRKSLDQGGTVLAFTSIQMWIACLFALLIGPIYKGEFFCPSSVALLGLGSGVVLAAMLRALGAALENGPPGFTFSILSSATVMPAVVMATLFGAAFGFIYTASHGIGSLLVLTGLFWAGRGLQEMQNQKKWVAFVFAMFFLHVLLLVIFQWRAMLLRSHGPEETFFRAEGMESSWFIPLYYLGAAFILTAIFLGGQRRFPVKREWSCGFAGGVANALCTVFLIQSTELATGLQSSGIFPLFSIGTIFFSNWWSQKIYKEKVHWRACQLSAFGILIGTVDWSALSVLWNAAK